MTEGIFTLAVMLGALFAALWMSPRALAWIIAKCYARREGLRVQALVMAWHLKRLEEE